VEIGGVEFLSQLRLHSDPSLHPLIDEVLEQLLKLPQSATDTLDSETAPPKFHSSGASLPSLANANPLSDSSSGERLQDSSSDQGSNIAIASVAVSEVHKPSDQRRTIPPHILQKKTNRFLPHSLVVMWSPEV